jgi:hypothetical protein
MAVTYTEVSTKYIMPGVNKIDRLSLPDAKELSPQERAQKVAEVGQLAKEARRNVKLLANAVSAPRNNPILTFLLTFLSNHSGRTSLSWP